MGGTRALCLSKHNRLFEKWRDMFSLANILGHRGLTVPKRYLALTNNDAQIAHAKYSPADSLK